MIPHMKQHKKLKADLGMKTIKGLKINEYNHV